MKYLPIVIIMTLLLIALERGTLPKTTEEMKAEAIAYGQNLNKTTPPREFKQDGCTLFPDKVFGSDFSEACLKHDIAYWHGGSEEERKKADTELRLNIADSGISGYYLQYFVYYGTQIFGDTWLTRLFEANWGFGWNE
ncbi:MAG: hypothetical protein R3B60_02240 [Candidatus Paceibacterota bacterium]